jgi:hypothetical protein
MAYDSFRVSTGVSALLPAVRLAPFSEAERQYYIVSSKPVAYSVQLEPLVLADYAGDGSVRGIEFVGKRNHPIEFYLEKALGACKGPVSKIVDGTSNTLLIGLPRSLNASAP